MKNPNVTIHKIQINEDRVADIVMKYGEKYRYSEKILKNLVENGMTNIDAVFAFLKYYLRKHDELDESAHEELQRLEGDIFDKIQKASAYVALRLYNSDKEKNKNETCH